MTRRAKLKLTPEDKPGEKQPLKFETTEGISDSQEPANAQPESDNGKGTHASESPSETTAATPNTNSWLNRKTLFKAALAVGATAIAIYMIKRRFK